MHPILKTISWLLLLYAGYCGFLFIMQRQILFPRNIIPKHLQTEPNVEGLEKIRLNAGFGEVEAWFIPPVAGRSAAPAPAVIFGHGNGELIDFWPESLEGFARLGIALLLVEYPGYGASAGSPSQDSITRIFVAAYDNLASRKDIDPGRIVFFGRSLGGGAVCALARKRPAPTWNKHQVADAEKTVSEAAGPKPGAEVSLDEFEFKVRRIVNDYVVSPKNEWKLHNAIDWMHRLRKDLAEVVKVNDPHELARYFEVGYIIDSSELSATAALTRQESRWGPRHRRTDYPERDDANWLKQIFLQIAPDGTPQVECRAVP